METGKKPALEVRPSSQEDREWVVDVVEEYWGSSIMVTRGRIHRPAELPALVCFRDGIRCGLVTYNIEGGECEIVTLNTILEGEGVGTALLAAVKESAREADCRRLWLITTNDNLDSVRFYQKRGFLLAALHRNAVEESRRLKPDIPMHGRDGIPVRDEIELEMAI